MKTLDEIFPSGRGDGRKVRRVGWAYTIWFEPIFKGGTQWVGLNDAGHTMQVEPEKFEWIEWHPPKASKKVRLYRPIDRTMDGTYVIDRAWVSNKDFMDDARGVVGWEEKEVEVYV